MSDSRPVLKVGLTGGIASGKSTVAGLLAELGAFVLDADGIVHDLLAPGGGAHDEVVSRFGQEILAPDGGIDRSRLGARIFADAGARRELEAILHPKVRAEAARRLEQCGRRVGILGAALLVETGSYRDFDRVIVTRSSRQTQIDRLRERDGLSEAEALLRLDAQASLEDKLAVADYVIDTDTSLDQTREQTERVYAALLRDHADKYGA